MSFEKISVIGLGYIGLPTAAMFASRKKQVVGVDVNQQAVDTINRGQIHIVEPDLDMLVHAAVVEGFLRATNTPEPADAFLIAVPTPFKKGYKPDLGYVKAAIESIAPVLTAGNIIILESTSPVGTTEKMRDWLVALRPDLAFPQCGSDNVDVNIAYCPERVLPGQVVRELVANDRVIGGLSNSCSDRSIELYKTFVSGDCVKTNARTAELAKLTENASRDVGIAFANELSIVADRLDVDVWELIALANRHPRVNILQPGPGVGGHCIAVDPWFIVSSAPEESRLIRTAREINDQKPYWVLEKVKLALADCLMAMPHRSAKELFVACLGITFKPDIDDLRGSPALQITQEICGINPGVTCVVEPNIEVLPESLEEAVLLSLDEALQRADIVVLLVDHELFRKHGHREGGFRLIDTKGIWR